MPADIIPPDIQELWEKATTAHRRAAAAQDRLLSACATLNESRAKAAALAAFRANMIQCFYCNSMVEVRVSRLEVREDNEPRVYAYCSSCTHKFKDNQRFWSGAKLVDIGDGYEVELGEPTVITISDTGKVLYKGPGPFFGTVTKDIAERLGVLPELSVNLLQSPEVRPFR